MERLMSWEISCKNYKNEIEIWTKLCENYRNPIHFEIKKPRACSSVGLEHNATNVEVRGSNPFRRANQSMI